MTHLIPLPAAITAVGDAFLLKKTTRITVDPELGASTPLAAELTRQIQNATGLTLTVQSGDPVPGGIHLTSADADPALGAEGYELDRHRPGRHPARPSPPGSSTASKPWANSWSSPTPASGPSPAA